MRLGIDFGTCFSSSAFIEGNKMHLVKDATSPGFSVPSSIFVNAQGQIIVGKSANNRRLSDPARYRRDLKRDLGKTQPFLFGDQQYLPEFLISRVLAKIKADADAVAQNIRMPAFTGVVLTIPATYQEHKRQLMRQAAVEAGFFEGEITLLEEPFAAALYYDAQNPLREGEILLVYDLGGGTFDTALLQKRGDIFEYLTLPAGIERCGGIDFDHAIYHYLLQQHQEIKDILQNGREDRVSLLARSMIGDICIEIKHQLSDQQEVYYPLVIPGLTSFIECFIDRPTFEQMIAPIVQETIDSCQKMLQRASISAKQINHVLLVGGSCRIPYVQRALRQVFQCQVSAAPDLELIVCQGAALYADTHTITTVSPDGRGKFTTITEAIEDAEPNSQIIIYPGVYEENFIIDKDIELVGSGPREEIIIQSSEDICVTIETEHAVLRGLTFKLEDEENYSEAAILVLQGKLVLEDCTILLEEELAADCPAGLLVEGEAHVRRCLFSLGARGRGVFVRQQGSVIADESEFCGIFTVQPTIDLNEIFTPGENDDNDIGGLVEDGSLTLRNCKLCNITLGVITVNDGRLTVENCQVYECLVGLAISSGNESLVDQCVLRDNFVGILAGEEGSAGQGKITNCEIFSPTIAREAIKYDEDGDPTFLSAGVVLVGGNFLLHHCNIHDCHFDVIYGEPKWMYQRDKDEEEDEEDEDTISYSV